MQLLSPLLAGSLERGLNVAEAMEARGFGRPGRTRAPQPRWGVVDHAALVLALLIVAGAAWL
jgi:energy-coupling factor transporter transmembrane protein EcfT